MFGTSGAAQYNRALEKATSQLLLEPDWDSILQIVDCIRQGDVPAKVAMQSIKKKISQENPHVSMFALQVMESCVKNCGSIIHQELATKETMEFVKDQIKMRPDPVRAKLLELIQVWSHAFRNEASYKVVQDTYNIMKMEGYSFPVLKEADAMFFAEKAPEWKDGEVCTRCRVSFGVIQRKALAFGRLHPKKNGGRTKKHHCRNCGDVFCDKCSSKNSTIPRFGIEKEVRVCDACYDKLNKMSKKGEDDLPAEYLASPLSKQPQTAPSKTEQEIQEEEELQLALALSKSEHESKQKERDRLRQNYTLYGGNEGPTSSTPQPAALPAMDTSEMDPELARYLNRNYWQQRSTEQKVATTTPSAPAATHDNTARQTTSKAEGTTYSQALQNGGDTAEDQSQFLNALTSSIEILNNRMRSNSSRGRSIANDTAVQSLFTVISNMHPQLLAMITEQEESRAYFEGLQDKLAQLRDAREALDALREEHREKRRRQMEELERQRQIQLAQKLEVMRQKKHEYLEMQRQLAQQRLQEQARDMAMRFEQQKQLTQMRQMQAYGYPQPMYGQGPMAGHSMQGPMGSMQGPMPGYGGQPQGGSAEGSPVHNAGGNYGAPLPQGMYPPQQMPSQPYVGPHHYQSGQQPGSNTSMPPVGYQGQGGPHPPPGAMDNGGVPFSQSYDPSQPPASLPPMSHHPPPQQQGPYASMDYSSFNMQSLNSTLPPMGNQPPSQPGGAPPGGMYSAPQQQVYMPPHSAPYNPSPTPNQQAPPPQQQQAPSNEASLISFD